MNVLVLLTDAFGSTGGIAQFNRDLLTALSTDPLCENITAIPRGTASNPGENPPSKKIHYIRSGMNGKLKYLMAVAACLRSGAKFDLVICAHLNLLGAAYLAKRLTRSPLLAVLYGTEAWKPSKNPLINCLISKTDAFASISRFTRQRFLNWTKSDGIPHHILPCCVDLSAYAPGRKDASLLRQYRLENKTILMTLGRLNTLERMKGFDEVLSVLPQLSASMPDIAYVIVGDGDDRARLEQKAETLGVHDLVRFTGYVPEEKKADYYRLADAYVMPSRGEGFGIVFLEAMACGIPVVASKLDAGREVLQEGKWGILVDPTDPSDVKNGILSALQKRAVAPAAEMEIYSYASFQSRVHDIIESVVKKRAVAVR